jgi:hypothetical protein
MVPRFGSRRDVSGIGQGKKIFQDLFMPDIHEILQAQHPAHGQTNLNEG